MGVAFMVQDFMGDRLRERDAVDGEEEEVDENGKSEKRRKHEKAVMDDLVRSAGGPLMKIRVSRAVDPDAMDES